MIIPMPSGQRILKATSPSSPKKVKITFQEIKEFPRAPKSNNLYHLFHVSFQLPIC